MEVILLSDVDKVGLRGEVVNVARGYARNFLLPRKLAEPATAGRVAELKRLDEQRARHEARSVEQANEIADVLRKTVLSFDVKSGPTGALFGSVTTTDIADELWRTRKIRVDRKKIETDSIRRIGRYAIPIQIFEDVTVEVKTLVVPEGGELPPEEELAAMEAAEAEAEAAKEAEAEAHRAEAEEILEAELAAEEEAAAATDAEAEPAAEPEPSAEAEAEAEPRPTPEAEPSRRPTPSRAGRRDRPAVARPQSAPQACGALCELPALSGHGCCGQWWKRPAIPVEKLANTGSLSPADRGLPLPTAACGSPAVEAVRRWRSNGASMAQVAPMPPPGAQSPHVPSHDLDAEMSVLSAMLLAPTAIAAVSEHLKASDFYRRTHGVIFDVARGLFERGEPVDAITVTAKLEEEGQLELVGGRGKIHEIAAWASAAGNAAHYALIVRDHALIRRLADAGREITRLAVDRGDETNHLISQAEQALFEVSQAGSPGELRSLKEALVETFERVSHLYEQGASVTGVSSGFSELDAVTAGFQPGNLIILAARPSMGKSALGISIAANVVRTGTPCAFFTLEMSKQEVTQRLICLEGKIDSHKIRTGKLAEEDWSRLSKACATLEQVPMFLDDTPGLTLFELRSRAQTLKRREPNLGMIIVDYLQLMAMGGNVESRLQEVSSLSRGLKALAKDLDVPIIALSQLSRAVEQRTDKRPVLSDLRESGSIEQDADLVMFIYRDEYYNGEESEQQGLAEVHVAKHRNGPTETIKLNFVKRYAKFSDHRAA